MAGGYRRLFDQSQQRPQQPQATPVHHTGSQAASEIDSVLAETNQMLSAETPGTPDYEELLRIKQALLNSKQRMGYRHDVIQKRAPGDILKRRAQDVLSSPDVENLEQGLIK